jgi:hypothetical protein
MNINKRLYFLHIPKTGGMTVALNFGRFLINNNLPKYPPSAPPHDDEFDKYAFIQGHLGKYPISKTQNLSIATVVRDPVDRAVSNFIYIYDKVLKNREEYKSIPTIDGRLKYYLFEDELYFSHRNIQSKFICSQPKLNRFKEAILEEEDYVTRSKSWYLEDVEMDFDMIKLLVDDFEIVNTTLNLNLFINRLVEWFNNNYPDLPVKGIDSQIFNINESSLNFYGTEYNTQQLKMYLSDKDIEKMLELNSLDFELYEYIYNKER